jgi:hypothetical protein
MKIEMSGHIQRMGLWAPGSPSTDVQIELGVTSKKPHAQLTLVVPKKDAEGLLYGQELRVTVCTVDET